MHDGRVRVRVFDGVALPARVHRADGARQIDEEARELRAFGECLVLVGVEGAVATGNGVDEGARDGDVRFVGVTRRCRQGMLMRMRAVVSFTLGHAQTLARRLSLALVAAVLLGPSVGCFRYRTHVPGVIDMRTDASGAEATRPRVEERRDDGLFEILLGRGAYARGERVVVEDRHYWVAGLIPLFNTDAEEELFALVEGSRAARDVRIGESITVEDALAALIVPQIVPLVGYVLPTYTFHASGTPIRLARAPRIVIEPAPSVTATPPTPPSTTGTPVGDVTPTDPPPTEPPLLDDAVVDPSDLVDEGDK